MVIPTTILLISLYYSTYQIIAMISLMSPCPLSTVGRGMSYILETFNLSIAFYG